MSRILEHAKPDFEQVLSHLEQELKAMRAGRASASMVELIPVEAYGSMMEMKGLASISVPDAKTIQIEPWDKNVVKEIEKALITSNLGMSPNVAGTVIRLVMPPMTEENRKNVVKVVKQKAEQARIRIRTVRETVRDSVADAEKKHEISEDEKFRLQEQLDKSVTEYNETIQRMTDEKEQDILAI